MARGALSTLRTGLLAALVGLTIGLVPSASAQDAVPLLTLDEAVEMAMSQAPSLQVAAADVELAQARELEAGLARLPAFSGRSVWAPSGPVRGNAIESTSGTDLGAIADLGDEFGFQTSNSIRATLPLYTFGKIELAEDLAHVGYEVAIMQRRKAELEVVFNVRQAYLGLQLPNDQVQEVNCVLQRCNRQAL